MTDVQPFGPRIAVAELDEHPGILIPEGADLGPSKGVVQAVGDDVPHLEPGMVIYYCNHEHPKIGNVTIINAECVVGFEVL